MSDNVLNSSFQQLFEDYMRSRDSHFAEVLSIAGFVDYDDTFFSDYDGEIFLDYYE